METTLRSEPKSRLLLPQPALSNCIFGAFVRDTRNCNLPKEQRFSHFASSPLCGITWTFDGTGHLLQNKEQMSAPETAPILPEIAFSGPYQTPQTSWSAGALYAMTLAFYPDAFYALTGIDIDAHRNRSLPVDEILGGELLRIVSSVGESLDAEEGFGKLEVALKPLWLDARPGQTAVGHMVADWGRSLSVRAAMTGMGKSTRQIERRVRSWTGHSLRRLSAYVRSEETFEQALKAKAAGDLNLADLSSDLGYADQSHMGRRVKEITGFSPAEFMERYETDECFWCFRLMGERFY